MNKSRRTRLLGLTAAAAMAATLSFGVGSTASASTAKPDASGGGCTTYTTGSGWRVGSCISANGITTTSDIYITSVGPVGADCFVEIYTFDTYGDEDGDEWAPCATGHYYGDSVTGFGFTVRTIADVFVNGSVVLSVPSPWQYM
jgi:hypothetical protein